MRPVLAGIDAPSGDEGASPWVVDIASGRVVRRTGEVSKEAPVAAPAAIS
ncbi:MAG: hypothetical protein WD557_17805 [Dehalococcoidia bacterium]